MSYSNAKYNSAPVPDRPNKYCQGRVTEIKVEPTQSDPNKLKIQARIEGYGASHTMPFYSFFVKPEWFKEGFHPRDCEDERDSNNFGKIIANDLNGLTDMPALQAILGTNFDSFTEEVRSYNTLGAEELQAALVNALGEEQPFGYLLTQVVKPMKDENGENLLDDEGKIRWMKEDNYKVKGFFPLTDKVIASIEKMVKKSGGKSLSFLSDDIAF